MELPPMQDLSDEQKLMLKLEATIHMANNFRDLSGYNADVAQAIENHMGQAKELLHKISDQDLKDPDA